MLAYLFIAVAIFLRFAIALGWVAQAYSFTPLGASLLFFGARGSRKQMWIPLVLLATTDILLNRAVYGYPLTADLLVTWVWYAAVIWFAGALRRNASPLRLAGAALATSISFFLVSNFAAWLVWDMYPKTFDGLMMAYVAGLPFFQKTLASDLFFTAVFFSVPVLLEGFSARPAALRVRK
jgi:hypothetical protein